VPPAVLDEIETAIDAASVHAVDLTEKAPGKPRQRSAPEVAES
jgi:hypothetical protein